MSTGVEDHCKKCIQNERKFLPNTEADEVEPRELIVSSHKDSQIGHSNVLEKEIRLV